MSNFITGLLLGLMLGWVATIDTEPYNYRCTFDRIDPPHYYAQRSSIHEQSTHITVKRDGRTFMFRRDQLIACTDPEPYGTD